MKQQLGEGAPMSLASLNGQLIAWRTDRAEPRLVRISGQKFVPIFADRTALDAAMASIGVEDYSVVEIKDGAAFIASLRAQDIEACFNLHRLDGRVAYTEIRFA